MDIIEKISPFVEKQFPDFYREEGRDFIFFVKTYYEFLEQEGYPIHTGRNFFDIKDIDKTFDKYLIYFVNKYMNGIPLSMLGDKRFIEKNILDLYRSKGSFEGLKLLFRLLYNEDVQLYIPQYDVLRPSDGKWVKDFYLEVSDNSLNYLYQGQLVKGNNSGATALIETVEERVIRGKRVNILFISHISGQFQSGELILCDTLKSTESSRIVGSVNQINLITKDYDTAVGDTFFASNGKGKYLKGSVTSLETKKGVIDFNLVNGGIGYSSNAVVTISTGSNTAGSGASFVVSGISNTFNYFFSDTIIGPYVGIPLSTSPFGGPYSNLAISDLTTVIQNALDFVSIPVGTITSITITNPGANYNGDVIVTITDPYTSTSPFGYGNNAVVTGKAFFQNSVMSTVSVIDSGFGYYDDNETITFNFTANTSKQFTGSVVLGGVGYSEGFWRGTDSFLNSDKMIHDSYFYQEYSYQIKSSRSFDKYIDVLRRITHPAGNLPFGKTVLTTLEEEPVYKIYSDIRRSATVSLTVGFNEWFDPFPGFNTFSTTVSPLFNNNYAFVSINGVVQNTTQYTTSSPNIVTVPGLVAGDDVGIFSLDSTYLDVHLDSYTGDGVTNSFNITPPRPVNEQDIIITINGVVQHTQDFFILNNNVTFINTPSVNDLIEMRSITPKSSLTQTQDIIEIDSYLGDGVTTLFNTTIAIKSEAYVLITINGVIQLPNEYSINTSNEIELLTPPQINDRVQIRTVRSNIRV